MVFNMYIPTRILFGPGRLRELGAQEMPGEKAMIVISNGKSAREHGYLGRTEEQLRLAGVKTVVFDEVEPNPSKETVMAGAAFARKHHVDFIVALGGGSCMDAAKVMAVMAKNEGDCWDYMSRGTGKRQPIRRRPLPTIAIPTTAGTGSEVDSWGVVSNDETHEKMGFGAIDEMFPLLAIVDPELVRTVSPLFTAFQGFDALFHSVEGYISRLANSMSDMYALTAIENVARNLPEAVRDGNNLQAREKTAFASTLSGVVMNISSCTSQHSLEHAMSAYHRELPHGAGLIMISKAYFTYFIEKHGCDERFARMAQAMGMEGAKDPKDFLTALVRLQEECGVADLKMSDYGIHADEFGIMEEKARATMAGLFRCDRSVLGREDCIAIYEKSYL